jgi:hypothetical protein
VIIPLSAILTVLSGSYRITSQSVFRGLFIGIFQFSILVVSSKGPPKRYSYHHFVNGLIFNEYEVQRSAVVIFATAFSGGSLSECNG